MAEIPSAFEAHIVYLHNDAAARRAIDILKWFDIVDFQKAR